MGGSTLTTGTERAQAQLLTCRKCLLLAREPVESQCNCAVVCCRQCVDEHEACPACGAVDVLYAANPTLARVIQVVVPDSAKTSCPLCGDAVLTSSLEAHVAVCSEGRVDCVLGCGARVARAGAVAHFDACPLGSDACSICGVLVVRRDAAEHAVAAAPTHVELLHRKLEAQQGELNRMRAAGVPAVTARGCAAGGVRACGVASLCARAASSPCVQEFLHAVQASPARACLSRHSMPCARLAIVLFTLLAVVSSPLVPSCFVRCTGRLVGLWVVAAAVFLGPCAFHCVRKLGRAAFGLSVLCLVLGCGYTSFVALVVNGLLFAAACRFRRPLSRIGTCCKAAVMAIPMVGVIAASIILVSTAISAHVIVFAARLVFRR